MELHLELLARELYMEAFFNAQVSDETKTRVGKLLKRNAKAFERMVKFSPYVGGDSFTLADCAAVVHLPLVGQATKIVYGEDVLAALPVREYVKSLADRASVQKVNTDRKAYLESIKK